VKENEEVLFLDANIEEVMEALSQTTVALMNEDFCPGCLLVNEFIGSMGSFTDPFGVYYPIAYALCPECTQAIKYETAKCEKVMMNIEDSVAKWCTEKGYYHLINQGTLN